MHLFKLSFHSKCNFNRHKLKIICYYGFCINALFYLFILILDLPVFNKYMDNEALSENIPVGQSVYKLEGVNSFGEDDDLIYGIEGTDHLVVDSNTGVVTIAKPLDHEVDIKIIYSVHINLNYAF